MGKPVKFKVQGNSSIAKGRDTVVNLSKIPVLLAKLPSDNVLTVKLQSWNTSREGRFPITVGLTEKEHQSATLAYNRLACCPKAEHADFSIYIDGVRLPLVRMRYLKPKESQDG